MVENGRLKRKSGDGVRDESYLPVGIWKGLLAVAIKLLLHTDGGDGDDQSLDQSQPPALQIPKTLENSIHGFPYPCGW